jgi:hypothetical protein
MYFLPLTIIFLVLFSIFSSSHLHKMKELSTISAISDDTMRQFDLSLDEKMQKKASADFRTNKPKVQGQDDDEEEDDEKAEEDNLSDAYRSCKLDICPIVATAAGDDTKTASTKKLLHNLIVALYSDKAFFEEAKKSCPRLEDEIIDDLIKGAKELEEQHIFKSPKDLCNVEGRSVTHKEVLYLILKGNAPKKGASSETCYPSLLNFLSVSRNRLSIASLWLARPSLLLALFGNAGQVDEVIKARSNIYEKLERDKKADPVTFEGDLKSAFERSLSSGIDKAFIDFRPSRNNPGKYDRDI